MKDNIANITRWILYVLIGIVVILGLLFYTNNLSSDGFINAAYWLLVISVAVMVVAPIYTFIVNPTNIVKILISLGLLVVVVIIAYAMASNTFTDLELETLKVDAITSVRVGVGLHVTYILFGLTILAAIYASVVKVFK